MAWKTKFASVLHEEAKVGMIKISNVFVFPLVVLCCIILLHSLHCLHLSLYLSLSLAFSFQQKKLDSVVSYRSNVKSRLEQHVQSLDQLNSALHLLEELRDMENKIDGIYLPIETMYFKLRSVPGSGLG